MILLPISAAHMLRHLVYATKCFMTNLQHASYQIMYFNHQGLVYAVPGPNLLDMACKMNTPLERLGLIFIGRSIGSLCGKYLSDCLVHRSKGYVIMTVSLVVLMIFQSVLPLASNLPEATFIMVALGGAHGLLSEGKQQFVNRENEVLE